MKICMNRVIFVKNSYIYDEKLQNLSFDEIGGYIDESAIAPEDEVPQNNFIDSIGYEDPTAEDPASEPLDTPADDGMSDSSDNMIY